jgi:hypothetical protein
MARGITSRNSQRLQTRQCRPQVLPSGFTSIARATCGRSTQWSQRRQIEPTARTRHKRPRAIRQIPDAIQHAHAVVGRPERAWQGGLARVGPEQFARPHPADSAVPCRSATAPWRPVLLSYWFVGRSPKPPETIASTSQGSATARLPSICGADWRDVPWVHLCDARHAGTSPSLAA